MDTEKVGDGLLDAPALEGLLLKSAEEPLLFELPGAGPRALEAGALPVLRCGVNVVTPPALDTPPPLDELVDELVAPAELCGVKVVPRLECGVKVVAPPALDTPVLEWLVEPAELWGVKVVPLLECGVYVLPPPALDVPDLPDDEAPGL